MQRAGHPSRCRERDGGFCSAPISVAQRSPDLNGGVISLLRRLVCAPSGEIRNDSSEVAVCGSSEVAICGHFLNYSTTLIRIVAASSNRPFQRPRLNSHAYWDQLHP